jgi:uncharacterized RDD family membrane protein YckC
MDTKSDLITSAIPNYIEERDIFGQVKPKRLFHYIRSRHSKHAPELNVNYAGFWVRTAATFIDILIISVVLSIIDSLFSRVNGLNDNLIYYRLSIALIIWISYNVLLDGSMFQATIGKMILNIKVIDLFGNKISISKALIRCISTIFSILPLGLGLWYITTDPKKQAWHDLIAGTFVKQV